MKRALDTRLGKLEAMQPDSASSNCLLVICRGRGLVEQAEALHFARRPQDRSATRILHLYTGVPRAADPLKDGP